MRLLTTDQVRGVVWVVLLLLVAVPGHGGVELNEVMPVDNSVLMDEDGDYPGWVELVNTGSESIDLAGYGLSDNPRDLFKWVFPSVKLEPGSTLIVFTSGKNRRVPPGASNCLTNLPIAPDEVPGLALWFDAAEKESVVLQDGKVAVWRDRSGRVPPRAQVEPKKPNALEGLCLWFDAADAKTLTVIDGQVARWDDKSGAGNHAVQDKGGARPVLRTDSASGLSVVYFDGQDRYLSFPRLEELRTVFWVGRESPEAPEGYRPLLGDEIAYDFHRGDFGRIYWSYAAIRAATGEARTWLNGEEVAPTMVALPSGMNLVTTLTSTPLRASTLSTDRYIAGRYWWGDIAEVIGFDRVLSDEERRSIETYLQGKWRVARPPVYESYDAFQTSAGRRPEYRTDAFTGLPHVWFDGDDDGLQFPRLENIRTVFWVAKADRTALSHYRPILGDTVFHDFHPGEARLLFGVFNASEAVIYGRLRLNGETTRPDATRLPSNWSVLSLVTGADCRANTLAWDREMTDRCFAGGFAEVIIYDRELSEAEVNGIEAYLEQKWMLPVCALHASFSLSSEGGSVYLTSPDATVTDELTFPRITGTCSFGKPSIGRGRATAFFDTPTPGLANPTRGYVGICPEPIVTPNAGFFQKSVAVVVESNEPGCRYYYTLDGSEPLEPGGEWKDEIWMDDTVPTGASGFFDGGDDWGWVKSPNPISGSKVHRSRRAGGVHVHGFSGASYPLRTVKGDRLFVDVFIDPEAPPSEVMVQWYAGGSWRRAFWGEDKLCYGPTDSVENYRVGSIPAAGMWARLEVPAAALGLEEVAIDGMAFCLYDGAAWWDAAGRSSTNISRAMLYSEPLVLTNTAVVRFRAVAPGYIPSQVVTRTYLVDFGGSLPVVSIAAAPADFVSEQSGILVAGAGASSMTPYYGANFWKRWEKAVNAEFIDPGSTNTFNHVLGLQVHGSYSRSAPQKSLELHARKRYGVGKIRCPVFPGLAVDEFETLMLRNGGNDWNRGIMRDYALQGLVSGLNLGTQAGRPVHVFLNGEYYGILNLREFADENHLTAHFGVSRDNIDMIFGEREVVAGDMVDYNSMVWFTRVNDLADPAKYAVATNWIDIDNYIDYEITQIFCDNRDWPGNNVLCWRPRTGDSRWRWIVDDLDACFDERDLGPARNTLSVALWGQPFTTAAQSALVFRSLMNSADFRMRFVSRFTELLNTRFLPENVIARIDDVVAGLTYDVERHIERWKDSGDNNWPAIQSVAQWRENVEHMRAFARARPAYVRNHLDSLLELGGTVSLTLDVVPKGAGTVRIDRLQLAEGQFPWSGLFFRKQPLTLQAMAQPGYRFVRWLGLENTNETVGLLFESDAFVAAEFETDEEYDLNNVRPKPHDLRWSDYLLTGFSATTPAGTYPPSMLFYQTSRIDPGLDAPMESEWTLPYNRDSRSRIRGLGEMGFSFVNTSDPQPEPGSGFLGASVLSLRTTGLTNIQVSWVGGTVNPNSRVYAIRLQYRPGVLGDFRDVFDERGQPVEYVRSEIIGDFREIGPVTLPPDADNCPVVQLRWKYYFIPTGASGARAELRVDDIQVRPGAGRRSIVLLSCGTRPNQRFWASYLAMSGETVEVLTSSDLKEWTPIRVLKADAAGRIEFEDTISPAATHRFYQLRRLTWN